MSIKYTTTDLNLTIYDPTAVNSNGDPVMIVRNQETNLGDLITDTFAYAGEADIGIQVAGGIRNSLPTGEITYDDIVNTLPYRNKLAVVEFTGQQMLDALEWGARLVPENFGGFLQVSGLTYDIDVSIPSPCVADGNGMLSSIEGERRVKNVKVKGEPIDPEKTYTLAGNDYTLLYNGNGYTSFDGCKVIKKTTIPDTEVLTHIIKKSPIFYKLGMN